jgi:hypothetical protein
LPYGRDGERGDQAQADGGHDRGHRNDPYPQDQAHTTRTQPTPPGDLASKRRVTIPPPRGSGPDLRGT